MWQEYAKSIGTTANNLTDAQKRQAEFNGFVAEGGIYAGSAAKYMDTYGGRLAQLSASFLNLRVAVGNSIIPVISRVLPYIKAAVDALTRWFNRIAERLRGELEQDAAADQAPQDEVDDSGDLNEGAQVGEAHIAPGDVDSTDDEDVGNGE